MRRSRRLIFSTLLLCTCVAVPATAFADPPARSGEPAAAVESSPGDGASNAIYLEVGGPALLYSINYERRLFDRLWFGAGVGYWATSESASMMGTTIEEKTSYLFVPVRASYLFFEGAHHLEAGAGTVIFHIEDTLSITSTGGQSSTRIATNERMMGFEDSGTGAGPFGIVGYRYQPERGGFMLRVTATPLLADRPRLWGGVSLGGAF